MTDHETVTVEDPETGRALTASILRVGEDVVVAIGGGERPHVGCVVLAQPHGSGRGASGWSASCSVLTIPPHKEEPIARGVATMLARASGRVAVVTAGVHDDNLDRAGIEAYLRLGDRLAEAVADAVVRPRG
jgi:hypothetical protein